MPVCVGSVSNIEHTVSQSLEPVYGEVGKIIREEKIIHVDETGYKASHKNGWSWSMLFSWRKPSIASGMS